MNKFSWISIRRFLSLFFKIINHDTSKLYYNFLRIKDKPSLYKKFVSTLNDSWLINSSLGDNINYQNVFKSNKKFLEQISDFDLKTYLNDDINTKVDRASMAFSLEARSPLIDYRIIEFSRSLPLNYKFNNYNKKRILKDVLFQYLPKELFNRPKSGFSMPFEVWFREDLREYVFDSLTKNNLKQVQI